MGSFIEFAQVLEGKIKKEIQSSSDFHSNNELETLENPGYLHLSWLLGNQEIQRKPLSVKTTPYRQYHRPPPPRKPHKLSERQKKAWDFFHLHQAGLDLGFTKKELKQGFRTLALRLHPDQGGSSGLFMELKEAYQALLTVFTGSI